MKDTRLQRLYREREDNGDDWILSVCASAIVGLSPCIAVLPFSTLLKVVIFIVQIKNYQII